VRRSCSFQLPEKEAGKLIKFHAKFILMHCGCVANEKEHLAQANRHIAEAEQRIAEQEERLSTMEAAGRDTAEAARLLKNFRDTLNEMRVHRRMIVEALSKP